VKLLVVEDEKDLADAIARGLTRQTYSVDISYDGAKALELAEINTYDLIILDLNLPEIDGLEVCRRIRANDPKIGILMLTARAGQADRVLGLDIGADDYLIKPFHFPELISRVRSILRRTGEIRKVNLQIDDLILDTNSISAYAGGRRLALTAKEFSILEYLMNNAGRVVILPYGLLAFLFAILGRSTAAGIGFGIGASVLETIITGLLSIAHGWLAKIPNYLLSTNIQKISSLAQSSGGVTINVGSSSTAPSVLHAFIVLAVYCVVFTATSYTIFQKRDVTG